MPELFSWHPGYHYNCSTSSELTPTSKPELRANCEGHKKNTACLDISGIWLTQYVKHCLQKKKRLGKIRGPLSSQNEQNTGSILFSNWWICLQSYLIKTIKLNNPPHKNWKKSTLNITFRVFTEGGNIFSRIA